MERNFNKNPYTIEELMADIARVASSMEVYPGELSYIIYNKNGGQITSNSTFNKFGGFAKIRNTYFPNTLKDLGTIVSLKQTGSYVNKLENQVGIKLNLEELVKDVISKLNVKVSTKKLKKTKKKLEKVDLVAMLNDLHIGQIIDSEEIGGINSFNFKEAGRRVAMFVKEVASYKDYKRDQVRTLHLPINGDCIAGLIHQTTTHSQHLLVHQMNGLIHILSNAIEYLRQDFDQIKVYGIAGNHDRMTHKEHGKRAINEVYDSYANIGFYAISSIFGKCSDVSFEFPKTPYVFMDLPAGRAMVAHGDHIFSTALGNVGKSINVGGLTNAIRDFNNGELSKGNKPIKLLLLGHVHCFMHCITADGVEVYVAPSLSGLDAFAHSLTINNSVAAQVVFESTSKFILGDSRLIRLQDADLNDSLDAIIPEYKKDLKWSK